MHEYTDHCCDTYVAQDPQRTGLIVVDSTDGYPAAQPCPCDEHEEI